MITLTSLSKIYRTNEIETVALENVNLKVDRGEFLSIMGPSGCGKSTLLNIMGLLDAPTAGTIEINGTHTEGMKDKELAAFRNKTLGFVFQSFHLINSLNVMDNVELPLLYRHIASSERRKLAQEKVDRGEFLSIMGPSGCGKSTLLNIMGLLDAPTAGTIEINGTHTEGMKDKELAAFRNKTLGFVFQSFHLINSLNVMDNVELPLLYRHIASSERRKLAQEVLEKVGLSHRMRHFPTQLSGGQCQRVAIARAIIGNPEIILADEPTGNLDSKMGAEVMELLHRLNKEDGRTIVMVTHNEEQAGQTSRTVRFFDGRQVQ